MATFTKLKSGSWRVQVRRKNEYVANTFIRRRDAEEWAIDVERSIDRGAPIRRARRSCCSLSCTKVCRSLQLRYSLQKKGSLRWPRAFRAQCVRERYVLNQA